MSYVILASQSKARKKILKTIGLKARSLPVQVREDTALKQGCSHLVIANALKKARTAAKRLKKGIVIGADTVILVKGSLIGKPKNTRDAERILTLLSHNPHWVYSGLAVIDIESGRCHTAYEKTKVYMSRLSSAQIKNYCRLFKPFDKAGGFDIQGPGALFIERIEGCYYNVVGLPLVKLVKILALLGKDVFTG